MELILASQSPRRRQLLEEQGYKTDVHPAQISESISTALPLDEALERLALDKARAVRPGFPDRTIIAADTVVVYDGEILGKPADDREACDFLMRLSGETHQVKTGVCILTPGMEITFYGYDGCPFPGSGGSGNSGLHQIRKIRRQGRGLRHSGFGVCGEHSRILVQCCGAAHGESERNSSFSAKKRLHNHRVIG